MPYLSNKSSEKSIGNPPLISIIIPSRNEEKRIGKCIETLKNQNYSNLEIIIVDDSTDNTVNVIKKIAGKDSRFKIIKQEKLPPGWVGKPFAVQQGTKIARGKWLLFIDADTYYDPKIVEKALEHVMNEKLDMLSLVPQHLCESFWEKVIQPIPLAMLPAISPLAKVNDPESNVATAFGPFILINKSVFEKVDGYESIKNKIADDAELANLIKTSGYKLGLANAQSLMKIRMYENFSDIWTGWSKNIFLGMVQKRGIKSIFQRLLVLIVGLFFIFDLMIFPLIAVLTSFTIYYFTLSLSWRYILLFSFAIWIISIIALVYTQRCYKIGKARYAPISLILGGIITLGIFLNSAIKTLSGKSVSWKGREYST
jgi:chlorobactene glucosyltransferase